MSDLKYEFACSHDPCVCDDALRGPFLIHPHAGEDWQDFRGVIQIMLRDGGLVLDGRLQAIADAWSEIRETGRDNDADEVEWLHLESLLDALVKEDQ